VVPVDQLFPPSRGGVRAQKRKYSGSRHARRHPDRRDSTSNGRNENKPLRHNGLLDIRRRKKVVSGFTLSAPGTTCGKAERSLQGLIYSSSHAREPESGNTRAFLRLSVQPHGLNLVCGSRWFPTQGTRINVDITYSFRFPIVVPGVFARPRARARGKHRLPSAHSSAQAILTLPTWCRRFDLEGGQRLLGHRRPRAGSVKRFNDSTRSIGSIGVDIPATFRRILIQHYV
jgi:hypothetical protein